MTRISLLRACATFAVLLAACSGSSTGTSFGALGDGGTSSGDPGGSGGDSGALDGSPGSDAATGTSYEHHVINFDDLADLAKVKTQYATWATFGSDPGCACEINKGDGYAASQPSYIWTYDSCGNGETASYFIDFAKPIRNFKVKLVGINDTTRVATLRLVKSDKSVTTHDVVGIANDDMITPVDLTGTSDDIVRVEIVNVTDSDGLGIDDVEFDFPR